ncbi:hypothetical protein CROQUDRAFT_73887 [Cronartium quercuum f. sp. fusiforme G11]|uniref:Major facilitator superfamily (MFS) profile domain-containing protein n=1 Tax=Cronartium quercuum f. sp. fusiforme G11 TaxID=708437 RepID=A0A9P6NUI4_9BASI|nr:hypothetical protein CROQUDRAFT_73887 [Cronartium quercuum f. sp. fusiforme G11]
MVTTYTPSLRPSCASTLTDPASPNTNIKSKSSSSESSDPISFVKSVTIISLCVLGFVVNNVSQLAINVILPVIQRDLDIKASNLQWLSSGFSLGYGSVLLLTGRLADLYGHKLFLQIGLFIFAGASLACALAQTSIQLSIFRAIMGLGAATIAPSLIGILGRTFTVGTKMRTAAFAALSAGAPLGAAIGLLVGGFITNGTRPSWRSFFYICLAFSVFVGFCATIIVPADKKRVEGEQKGTVDWFGAGLIVAGLAMLISSLATSSRTGWNRAVVLGPFVTSIIVLLGFVGWETYLERAEGRIDPLVKLSLFKRGCFGAVQCIAGLLWLAFVVANFFLNFYFQDYLHLPLTQTVIRFIPMLIIGLLLNLAVGYLANIWPGQVLMLIGCLGTTISCLLMAIMDPSAIYWTYNFFSISLSVIGPGFVFAVGTLYGARVANKNEQAVAGGIFHTFAQIGSAIGLSIATIVQVEVTQSESMALGFTVGDDLSEAPAPAYLKGLRASFWTCFSSVALATLISALFLRKMGHVRPTNNLIDKQTNLKKVLKVEQV